MNENEIKQLVKEEVQKALAGSESKAIHPSRITPKMLKARHLEDVVIKFGLAADRPADGGKVNVQAYFSTDDDTLALWNGSAWVEEIFT